MTMREDFNQYIPDEGISLGSPTRLGLANIVSNPSDGMLQAELANRLSNLSPAAQPYAGTPSPGANVFSTGELGQNMQTAPITKPSINDPNAFFSNYYLDSADPNYYNTVGPWNTGRQALGGGIAAGEMIDERMTTPGFNPYNNIIQQDFGFQPQGTPIGTQFELGGGIYSTTLANQASMMPEPYEWGYQQASATNPFAQQMLASPMAGSGYAMQPMGQQNIQGMYGLPAGEFNMMPTAMMPGATFDAPRTFQDQGGSPFTTPDYYGNYSDPFNPYSYWNR